MGDGVLVEFGSAVNAVACAVRLQKRMAEANEGVAGDRHIDLRIGINLGDVVVEGGDLYGDGVVVAVRLQAMADPGGICLSGSVHEQVATKLPIAFDDLGPCEVKNIARPVRVFRLTRERPQQKHQPTAKPSQSKPSIAVLPFTNMSAVYRGGNLGAPRSGSAPTSCSTRATLAGAETWHRILNAIERLQARAPADGEKVH